MPSSQTNNQRGGTRGQTAAQLAFAASGLTHAQVARSIRVGQEGTVKRLLRDGTPCYETALRLSRALRCDIVLFLPRQKAETLRQKPVTPRRTTATVKPQSRTKTGPTATNPSTRADGRPDEKRAGGCRQTPVGPNVLPVKRILP